MSNEAKMVPLCGLWENKSQSGDSYLSGYLGDSRIIGFRNKFKEAGDKKPEWKLYLAPKQKKEEEKVKHANDADNGSFVNDDIPF